MKKDTTEVENEVDKLLNKACVNEDENFNILAWWKFNAMRFNIFSKIAKDVLVVSI